MSISLQQVQTQKLVLTTGLVQAIKILQCTTLELNDLIEEELLTNPMLELSDNQPDVEAIENKDQRFDWTEHAKERSYDDLASKKTYTLSEQNDYNYEQFVKADISLFDYLHTQLAMIKLSAKLRSIASYIIDTLNEYGYRTERASEVAEKFGLEYDQVIKAIKTVQSLEPAGIAAKSLSECLQLQLERSGKYNKVFEDILYHHLDDMANNKIAVIAKAVKLSLEDTNRYCDEIKALNPKPGASFGSKSNNKYIIPDLELKEFNGDFIVLQNERITPLINASPYYDRLLKEAKDDKEATAYLHQKMESALWLIKGIEQRRQTIQKVAEAIIRKQKAFLREGVSALKPMTLSDIAIELDIHESTVSRAVNGKYIQTPRGLFELKSFFSNGVSSITGALQSAESVKKQIKDIIDSENPKKPYSDEKIGSLLLSNYGTSIARRTIAKYRETLGIPGASKRKVY